MKENHNSIAFLLFMTALMMPPAGLWLILRYLVGSSRRDGDSHARLVWLNQIASRCVTVLSVTAFIQVGLYIFTVTKGPHIIDFLDAIY